jgi:hypothetical protein
MITADIARDIHGWGAHEFMPGRTMTDALEVARTCDARRRAGGAP